MSQEGAEKKDVTKRRAEGASRRNMRSADLTELDLVRLQLGVDCGGREDPRK